MPELPNLLCKLGNSGAGNWGQCPLLTPPSSPILISRWLIKKRRRSKTLCGLFESYMLSMNEEQQLIPNEKIKRQSRLNLRLSDSEFEMVQSKAKGFGLPLAKFVRVCLLDLPKPIKRTHDLPIVNPDLYRQLVSIGNNINQLTRYAHTASLDPKKNLDVLELAYALQKIANELEILRLEHSLTKAQIIENEAVDMNVAVDETK